MRFVLLEKLISVVNATMRFLYASAHFEFRGESQKMPGVVIHDVISKVLDGNLETIIRGSVFKTSSDTQE